MVHCSYRNGTRGFAVSNTTHLIRLENATKRQLELYEKALQLRARIFRGDPQYDDTDQFDAYYTHVVVASGDEPVAYQRMHQVSMREVAQLYSGQEYLFPWTEAYPAEQQLIDVGRTCVSPDHKSIRTIFRLFGPFFGRVMEPEVAAAIGCVSFPGADPKLHLGGLQKLKEFIAPPELQSLPNPSSPFASFSFAELETDEVGKLPSILQTYLRAGAIVGSFGVSDTDVDTFDVSTMFFPDRMNVEMFSRYSGK